MYGMCSVVLGVYLQFSLLEGVVELVVVLLEKQFRHQTSCRSVCFSEKGASMA